MIFWTPHLCPLLLPSCKGASRQGLRPAVPCRGAAPKPCQAPGKGSSGVSAIDISSAGSPSGSDGILEHGNGSCLVEKANLPQLYRISAGVLGSPGCHQPRSKPRSRHSSLKPQQSNLGPVTARGSCPEPGRAPREVAKGSSERDPQPGWQHRPWVHGTGGQGGAGLLGQGAQGAISSGPPAQGCHFPGEEAVGTMPGGTWSPLSATCKRRWEASVRRREKQGRESSLVIIWLFWQRSCSLPGLTPRGFAHPWGLLAAACVGSSLQRDPVGLGGCRRGKAGMERLEPARGRFFSPGQSLPIPVQTWILKAGQPMPAVAACCITMAKSIFPFLWR